MTTLKRCRLQIDDPLGSSPPAQPTEPGAEAATPPPSAPVQNGQARSTERPSIPGRRGKRDTASPPAVVQEEEPPARQAAGQAGGGVWRTWSGITGVGSFRLPHELLIELGDSARELQLPIGMIVTAAITQLLDQAPEVTATLVDRADDARIQGRRSARRRRTEDTGE